MKVIKVFFACFFAVSAFASPFEAPPALQPRVEFWIDVFSKYSGSDFVVHHRMYPQVVFLEIFLAKHADLMSAVAFENYKKRQEKLATQQVSAAIKNLSLGLQPKTSLEKHIVAQMAFIPGGRERYSKILNEDLIRTQSGIKERTAEAIQRAQMYLPVIQQIFTQEYALPTELTLIPMIESSFNYEAFSSVGAAGIWQLMPVTARGYGLRVNSQIDERRDVVEASRAAAKYFRDAYSQLGSWPLAITSYNHGVYGVKKNIKKVGTRDISRLIEHPSVRAFGFASNNFFPEFLAALHIYKNHKVYFPDLQLPNSVSMTQVVLPNSYNFSKLANQLGVDTKTLSSYNYALLNPVIRGAVPVPAGYKLKIPRDVQTKVSTIKNIEPEKVSQQAASHAGMVGIYIVRSGDSLDAIAKRHRTTIENLQKINGLKHKTIYIGQRLRIQGLSSSTVQASSSVTNNSATVKSAPIKKAIRTYQVRKGDTLWSISKRFGVSLGWLRSANKIKANEIKIGQKIIVG